MDLDEDAVAEWHAGSSELPLHEHLGMTRAEYEAALNDLKPKTLPLGDGWRVTVWLDAEGYICSPIRFDADDPLSDGFAMANERFGELVVADDPDGPMRLRRMLPSDD